MIRRLTHPSNVRCSHIDALPHKIVSIQSLEHLIDIMHGYCVEHCDTAVVRNVTLMQSMYNSKHYKICLRRSIEICS